MLKEANNQERGNKNYKSDEQSIQVYQANQVCQVNEGVANVQFTPIAKLSTL